MKLNVKDLVLKKGVGAKKVFDFTLELQNEQDLYFKKPITGKVEIINLEDRLLANFSLKTEINLECARCLKSFPFLIDLGFETEYLLQKTPQEFYVNPDFTIDIEEPIRQEILLNVPMKPLCKKNCKGIKIN